MIREKQKHACVVSGLPATCKLCVCVAAAVTDLLAFHGEQKTVMALPVSARISTPSFLAAPTASVPLPEKRTVLTCLCNDAGRNLFRLWKRFPTLLPFRTTESHRKKNNRGMSLLIPQELENPLRPKPDKTNQQHLVSGA
jgi:hypothetical protein